MKRVIKLVVVYLIMMQFAIGCGRNTEITDSDNVAIKTEKEDVNNGETPENSLEASMEAEEVGEKAVNKISIISDELNQLTFSGYKHYVENFNAVFQLKNESDKPVDFAIRIPHKGEDITDEKGVFAFLNEEGIEQRFHLEANEQKEFSITTENSDVVGYFGEYENRSGGIGGMVYEILYCIDGKWSLVSLNEGESKDKVENIYDIETMKLLAPYDMEIISLKTDNQDKEIAIDELKDSLEGLSQDNSKLPEYTIFKHPELSGLRVYDGSSPIKVYPSASAENLLDMNEVSIEMVVNCRGVVDCEGKEWGMVLFSRSGLVVGFVEYSALSEVVDDELPVTVEALGGFKLGDRIEKYIGILDRDYVMLYENGPIYIFNDEASDPKGGHNRVFSGDQSIDVFPDEYFRTWLVRTNSPQFPLNCGYKVGDNAKEVLDYFTLNYEESDNHWWGEVCYQLTENENISFRLSQGDELEERVIESIWIHY